MAKLVGHRWKAWTELIPRRTKVLFYFLATLCFVFLFYIFMGAPSLSREHRYRRVERSHFVGPGKILGYETVSGGMYTDAVVARTKEGVIVATMIPDIEDGDLLVYVPITGKITVTAAPQVLAPKDIDFQKDTLTVFAVDDYPQAVRAEMDLKLYWQQFEEEEAERPVFHLQAKREQEGYFRFDAPFESLDEDSPERQALKLFSQSVRAGAQWNSVPEDAFQATLRLYDMQGNLVAEETMVLHQ